MIKSQVQINPNVHPDLYSDLAGIPSSDRAERLRYLAALGERVERTGTVFTVNSPVGSAQSEGVRPQHEEGGNASEETSDWGSQHLLDDVDNLGLGTIG